MGTELEDVVRDSWDQKAAEWDAWIGPDGDRNRRVNSDPVLHELLGDVDGLDVLDAGCGTGYLSIRLARSGARLTSIDLSPNMVQAARNNAAAAGVTLELHVSSCSSMSALADASFDRVVSNYVLMDLPDLSGAMHECARVLRPGGFAVLVFLHPCFNPPDGVERLEDGSVRYRWPAHFPYIGSGRFEEDWGPFTSSFIGFHRPLSDYFAAILAAGMTVEDLREPVAVNTEGLTDDQIQRARMTAYSVVLKVRR